MHLTAPAPIHPSSVGGANQQAAAPTPLSPNTLQVNQAGAALKRVPSPQELIVHTQAIMQNALIKKQLEDQKERYLKRQGKSPLNTNAATTVTLSNVELAASAAAPLINTPTAPIPKVGINSISNLDKWKRDNF